MPGLAGDRGGWRLNAWLRRLRPQPHAAQRIVVFPHAGGSAGFFRPWIPDLPAGVELLAVQYPGRDDRMRERAADHMDQLVGPAVEAMVPVLDRPFVLFGHSMGAAVAYEVALRVQGRAGPALAGLVVSGQVGPTAIVPRDRHLWPDPLLWQEVQRMNGTDERVAGHGELASLVLPRLRSDFRVIETYRPTPGPPLRCPVVALVGDRDTEAPVDRARRWADVTRSGFELHVFPGGDHFYLVRHQSEVVDQVVRCLGHAPDSPSPSEGEGQGGGDVWESQPPKAR